MAENYKNDCEAQDTFLIARLVSRHGFYKDNGSLVSRFAVTGKCPGFHDVIADMHSDLHH
jgi:hypothetical protein